MKPIWKTFLLYFLLVLSGMGYYQLTYQTQRADFIPLIALFTGLFILYGIVFRLFAARYFTHLLIAGLLFRLLLLGAVPNLSEDVYRFIWDGRLWANGILPFRYLPAEVMQMPAVTGITPALFAQLNSPSYYTIYPPLMQGVFWLTAQLFPLNTLHAIVCIKSIILVFELGTVLVLWKLLKKLSLPKEWCLLYFLNPLVIIELTGSAHLDGMMVFFVLLSFLLLLQNNWKASALFLGFGVAAKLMPVLFLPLVVYKLGWKKGIWYSLVVLVTILVLFATVLDLDTLTHLFKSADLFIRRFEFNASIYYLIRALGMALTGTNIITYAGPLLTLLAGGIIFFVSKKHYMEPRDHTFIKGLVIISIWYLFATTVHPWYICLPVALSVCTHYRYAIVWSFTACLSYSAYATDPVQEKWWLLGLGYLLWLGYAWWEWKNNRYLSIAFS